MPVIPTYQRRMSIPGEGPNALQDVGSAGLVGNSIARMGNVGAEFIGLIQHQQEDLRKRRATVENSRLTNSANNFLTNQKIEFDTNANTMDSSINLASYAGQHEESIKPTFKSLIKFDEITDPDVLLHAQTLTDTVDAHFRDHTAVAQQKALGSFASKEIDTGGLNAIAMARSGMTPEESMKSAAEIIQNMHNTGVINTDKASEFTVKIQQQVVSNYMESLSVSDPKKYIEVVKSGKYNNIMSTADYNHAQEKAKTVGAQETGTSAGVEIFKADKTGSIESMTDAVRAKKLGAETEKVAIGQVKELYNERKVDEEKIQKDAIKEVNEILVPIALGRNGLNKQSDLTPAQWTKLMDANPEYAGKLQDNMRKELDYQTRQNKADTVNYQREKRLQQADNESLIIISDDFATRDLKSDLSKGDISPSQYRSLSGIQAKLDPIKRDSVITALSKVNAGIGAAIGVKNKAVQATWKLKYGDLVKAFAYKNADDPNFDTKLSEFVEKQVLSKMVTSWFSGDEVDRVEKYNKAKEISGELPIKATPQKEAIKNLPDFALKIKDKQDQNKILSKIKSGRTPVKMQQNKKDKSKIRITFDDGSVIDAQQF